MPAHTPPAVVSSESGRSTQRISSVEVTLPLDGLAHSLMKMRRWLSERGCGQQAFRCVGVGPDALVTIDFDEDAAGLIEDFSHRFRGRELTYEFG